LVCRFRRMHSTAGTGAEAAQVRTST
jgi:hypothetical protein